jgi:hypothetical protein
MVNYEKKVLGDRSAALKNASAGKVASTNTTIRWLFYFAGELLSDSVISTL